MTKEERKRRRQIKIQLKKKELKPVKLHGSAWQPKPFYRINHTENAKRLAARFAINADDWRNMKIAYIAGNIEYLDALDSLKAVNRTLIESIKDIRVFFETLRISLSKRNRMSKDECDALRAEVETIIKNNYTQPAKKNA